MAVSAIRIVNAADQNYVPHTAAMLHSVRATNPNQAFEFHFVSSAATPERSIAVLRDLSLRLDIPFFHYAVAPETVAEVSLNNRFTEEAYYRLFLPEILSQLDRVLWLDSDTIVCGALADLWATELNGHPLAACPNANIISYADHFERIGVDDRRLYFNSGVMILDLAELRRRNNRTRVSECLAAIGKHIKFADQDVLNRLYLRDYRRLELKWNFLTHSLINVPETVAVHGRAEFRDAKKRPRVLHFTGPHMYKPWSYRCAHPRRQLYRTHREQAGIPLSFSDVNLQNSIMRHLPLRLGAILRCLFQGRILEARSYVLGWPRGTRP